MPNNEGLNWLLTVNADTAGAEKFNRSLKDAEAGLGHVDKATSKTEHAMESAGHKAAAMGAEAAAGHHKHAEAVEHASEAYHRHRYETEGVGKDLRELTGRAHEFAEAIGLVLAFEVMEKGIDLVKELGSEVLHTAAEAERLGKSFEFRFGVEGGKEAIEYAEKFAKNTEFTAKQSKGFVSELGRAGVPLEEMDKYMAAAGDMAAMTGDKVQGMAGAIAGLGRARMTGAFDMRELRMIGIGVEQLKELPEFAKKSKEELRGLMKAGGSITEEQLFRVIASKGPETNNVGDVATQMSTTMGSQLDKLAELPERYIEKFRDSKGFDQLKARFADTIEALDPDGPTGGRIFGALESVFDLVAGKVAGIDFGKLADQITTDVVPAVKEMTEMASSIDWVSGVKSMVGLLETAFRIVNGIGVAIDAVSDAVSGALGAGKGDTNRKAVQAAAANEIPSDVRRAVVKEVGELPEMPASAAAATQDYEAARNQRQTRNRIRRLANHLPFVDLAEEQPSAAEIYQGSAADAMRKSEAAGPQLPKDRVMSPVGKAPAGADAMTPYFESAGKDAAAGYVRGLTSDAGGVGDAGAEVAKAALKGTAKAQESSSPSRKFARLGDDAVDGYTDALDDGAGDAARAGAGLSAAGLAGADSVPGRQRREAMGLGAFEAGSVATGDDAPPAPAPAAPARAGGGPVTITIPITISVGGAGAKGADEAVDRLRSVLPGAMSSALEQLGIEAGV